MATCLLVAAGAANAQAIDVRVERRGNLVVIDVKAPVAASAGDVWSVLIDYDHMASFMSNVATSSVLRREGNLLEVAKSGSTKVALFVVLVRRYACG